eukprot:m.2833 g.2833  ORF g.2833 m.2833 type:complete len:55 (-) comp2774_c0_seq1:65-229(-)
MLSLFSTSSQLSLFSPLGLASTCPIFFIVCCSPPWCYPVVSSTLWRVLFTGAWP